LAASFVSPDGLPPSPGGRLFWLWLRRIITQTARSSKERAAFVVCSGVFVVELADRFDQVLDVIHDVVNEIGKRLEQLIKSFHLTCLL
jgi:hypothetical protein